jgi:hypothetical protein
MRQLICHLLPSTFRAQLIFDLLILVLNVVHKSWSSSLCKCFHYFVAVLVAPYTRSIYCVNFAH